MLHEISVKLHLRVISLRKSFEELLSCVAHVDYVALVISLSRSFQRVLDLQNINPLSVDNGPDLFGIQLKKIRVA